MENKQIFKMKIYARKIYEEYMAKGLNFRIAQ